MIRVKLTKDELETVCAALSDRVDEINYALTGNLGPHARREMEVMLPESEALLRKFDKIYDEVRNV